MLLLKKVIKGYTQNLLRNNSQNCIKKLVKLQPPHMYCRHMKSYHQCCQHSPPSQQKTRNFRICHSLLYKKTSDWVRDTSFYEFCWISASTITTFRRADRSTMKKNMEPNVPNTVRMRRCHFCTRYLPYTKAIAEARDWINL